MGGSINLRHLGMIATSGSWRRWWLEWRWARYRWVGRDSPSQMTPREMRANAG